MLHLQKERPLCQRLPQQKRQSNQTSWALIGHHWLFSSQRWNWVLFLITRGAHWWNSVRTAKLIRWFWKWWVSDCFSPTTFVSKHYHPYPFHKTPHLTLQIPKTNSGHWSSWYRGPTKYVKPRHTSISVLATFWRKFKAINGKLFTTTLITRKPIGIQIFPNCVSWTKVISSHLPNKDILLGFDIIHQIKHLQIIHTGIRVKSMFKPFTNVLKLYDLSETSQPFQDISTKFLKFCPESHADFHHPIPCGKIHNSLFNCLSSWMKMSIPPKPLIQECVLLT